jgi:glutathione S-transferase
VSDELPVLWQYSFSNYNEKARWALDYKRIPHRRRSLLPMSPRAFWFSRGDGTLPVLDLDGERIVDSTAIIAALERRQPEPALYPADPGQRRRALELEDYFDEHAGHDMRTLGFMEWRDETDVGAAILTTGQPPAIGSVFRRLSPVVRPLFMRLGGRRYGWDESSLERSKRGLASALDRIELERKGGRYLVGESFTVADLTAAALLWPLAWPPEFQYELPDPPYSPFREAIAGNPALAWLSEIWSSHRGHSAAV